MEGYLDVEFCIPTKLPYEAFLNPDLYPSGNEITSIYGLCWKISQKDTT